MTESTRSLYQKKLAILIRGESDTQNGDQGNQPTNGFDQVRRSCKVRTLHHHHLRLFPQYSADEDTEEEQTSPPEKEEKETEEDEDEQPAPVVTRTTPKLEEESQNKSNLSLRQRFSCKFMVLCGCGDFHSSELIDAETELLSTSSALPAENWLVHVMANL